MKTDSLYYIMDYSGNYYRIDMSNQLVTASEKDATLFTLSQAIDLVELLRVCRENRRDIKDELQRIEYFQNQLGTNANLVKANQALKSMKGLANRKYKPRKYEELFENCVMKEKHLQKDDLCSEQIRQENEKKKFERRYVYEEKGEEIVEERIYTPFDGKENDWMYFAKQQVEFYKHAGQYIKNLQIDLREIEEEIEDVLLKTEDANCNVAQGYKVFKKLKELRLEKKAKEKELQCLYALTDYIDCDALADTCEDNLAEVEGIMGMKESEDLDDNQVEDSMCSKVS